jgi:hypothetical protein
MERVQEPKPLRLHDETERVIDPAPVSDEAAHVHQRFMGKLLALAIQPTPG